MPLNWNLLIKYSENVNRFPLHEVCPLKPLMAHQRGTNSTWSRQNVLFVELCFASEVSSVVQYSTVLDLNRHQICKCNRTPH